MKYFLKKTIGQLTITILFSFSLLIIGCSSAVLSKKKEQFKVEQRVSILENIKTKKVIRIGTTGDFIPFSYHLDSKSETYLGIDMELAKNLAQSLNAELELVQTTWKTMMADLLADKFDICMSGVTITLARQQQALFSIPLLISGKAAITRDEDVDKYNSLEAINKAGVKVIVNPGGTNEIFSKANFPKATIIENEDNLSIFKKIIDGAADLMVTDAIETLVQEQIHPELEAVNPEAPFNFFEMGYLLPVDHTFKAYVDQWLNLRLKDGTYQKIFDAELLKIKLRADAKNE